MNHLTRRQLLAASGLGLASAGLWNILGRRALAAPAGTKRIIVWHVPEGCQQQAFWPGSGTGALNINMSASIDGRDIRSDNKTINDYRSTEMGTYCLQPLKDHESDILLMSGFVNQGGGSDDDHHAVTNSALAGSENRGRSLDQVLGNHLQGESAFHAINSALFGAHAHDGASATYLTPVRYEGGGAGSPSWNPVTTYNEVFPSGIADPNSTDPRPVDHRLTSKLALLGKVKSQIAAVRCAGGDIARDRMEAYLESLERVESSTQSIIENEQNGGLDGLDLRVNIPEDWLNTSNSNRYWEKSDNFGALCKIQIDTAIAALALDRTRVSFMQFSGTGNDLGVRSGRYDGLHYNKTVPGLETQSMLNDHLMGHQSDGNLVRDHARIYRWYYEQLAYLVERLKQIPDGNGETLFDGTLIFCCSGFGSPHHRRRDPPYMLIGNPGGAFVPGGQYFDAYNGSHRNHADLLLAIAQGMGMGINEFADSSSPYTQILA